MKIAMYIDYKIIKNNEISIGETAAMGVEIPIDADEDLKNKAINTMLNSANDYLKKLVFGGEDE